MTTADALAKIAEIEANPNNHGKPGSLFRFTKAATKKLDDLRRVIASNMRAERIAKGLPVNDDGYSGRKTNRR